MSGALGLAALLFAAIAGITLAWVMWSSDRRAHQRKLEALQRRIEHVQAQKSGSDTDPQQQSEPGNKS